MAYKRWTEEEFDYLVNNITKLSFEELSKEIGRPEASVRQKAINEGLYSTHKPKEKIKYKTFYEPTSINAIRQTYGINV